MGSSMAQIAGKSLYFVKFQDYKEDGGVEMSVQKQELPTNP